MSVANLVLSSGSLESAFGQYIDIGQSLPVLTRNKQRSLRLYGVASEPDFLFGIPPGHVYPNIPTGSLLDSRSSIPECGRFHQVGPIVTNF